MTYATTLLQQHIQTIANEQLVLDWSNPNSELEEEDVPQSTIEDAVPLDQSTQDRCNERLGVPVEAFPPSLIKWPGHNNNRQRRLSEIKKQVKLLSNIIKMTIEGTQEQPQSVGSAGAGGYSNPAPFTSFVDMSSIPSSALANASAEESFLPTIDEITEYVHANKLKEAKAVLRNAGGAVTCPTRPTLWLEMCKRQTTEQYSDSFYYDTLHQIYGTKDLTDCSVVLPAFVDLEHLGRGLTPEGVAACGRIISVLAYYYPPITHAPALHPLASCLLLYMNESDVYNSLSALVCSPKVTFATQTKTAHEVAWRTTLTLARKHVGAAFSTLEKHGIDSKQVEVAFQNWLWWILEGIPVPHMIRVIDCFLMEGWKVLVRVALAIFQLFIRHTSRDSSAAALLSTKGLSEAIMIFCQSLSVTPAKLLKSAFGIRALSMSEITKVMTRTEELMKRQGGDAGAEGVQASRDMSSLHSSELPTSNAQANVQMLSHTLNVKELLTIWNWLPVRMTMYQPSLLYTTEEHGSSLTTFYQRVEGHDQTILLVRTTCNHVFGAYCSVAWDTRHKKDEYGNKQTYYGTGESFLFTLRPVPAKYQWVGITQQKQDASLSNVSHSEALFMHGDDEMITVGGGEGQGLMLDHELQFGKTESCKTFDNPPLCASKDFEIKVVEVYGIDASS